MKKIDFEMATWLDRGGEYDVFATVTFKQAFVYSDGVVRLTRNEIENCCGFIRDRVFRKCKRKFLWITSIEGGAGGKRLHAHIAIRKPEDIEFSALHKVFVDACRRMHSVDDRIEMVPVVDSDDGDGSRKIIFYMLKEGVDAVSLHASHLNV